MKVNNAGHGGVLKYLLDGKDYEEDRIRKPVFRNYDDLREILKEAFIMYEDFKREVLSIYSNSQQK
jgi:dsDNA-binding SOS-regulon protein